MRYYPKVKGKVPFLSAIMLTVILIIFIISDNDIYRFKYINTIRIINFINLTVFISYTLKLKRFSHTFIGLIYLLACIFFRLEFINQQFFYIIIPLWDIFNLTLLIVLIYFCFSYYPTKKRKT